MRHDIQILTAFSSHNLRHIPLGSLINALFLDKSKSNWKPSLNLIYKQINGHSFNKLEIDQAPSVSQVFQGLILKGVKHQVELNITGKPWRYSVSLGIYFTDEKIKKKIAIVSWYKCQDVFQKQIYR